MCAAAASEHPFDFLRMNRRADKPRRSGLTEIRGPYYTPMGPRYLEDLLETAGDFVDGLKFAGGSFALMSRDTITALLELAHRHGAYVSTGGFIEYVLTQPPTAVERYLATCRDLGFDVIELSTGFITLSADDILRLIEQVQQAGMKPKPEVGIQFGAGGASSPEALAEQGTRDIGLVIADAQKYLAAGAEIIMLESEGITESVTEWRTDVPARFATALGLERIMFEAADPAVFTWYVRQFGPAVNLFVDHSQIIQLECLRRGIWGTAETWGRIIASRNKK